MKKYIIVGGVAGGATAAARLRRLDEQAEIILVERGGEISFANCGLPYYVGGVIKERDELLLMLPQRFRNIFNVDVRTHSEVVKVDTANKKVSIRNSKGEYEESYDALVLSPGAKALRPPIPGIDNKHILTLRNVPDADALRDLSLHYPEGKAVVIGGGFVGIEVAEVEPAAAVLIDEGEGRAGHLVRAAQSAGKSPGEGRLAHPQPAAVGDDLPRLQQPGNRLARRFSLSRAD